MTIQISLVIWTIIGFCVLAFVLNKFLFKPLLAVMDAREQKIREGKEKRQSEIEAREKKYRASELAYRVHQKEAEKAAEKALADECRKTTEILSAQQAEYEAAMDKFKADLDSEAREIEAGLSEKVDQLALKYVRTLKM